MGQTYYILHKSIQLEYEEKKSRFIAQLWPMTEREQFNRYLNEAKQTYPDARHHCWAYIIGQPQSAQCAGFNDDGEPSGTAGKPMLNVLIHREVGNICVVVSRYFGGIKLGAGGLTRAYGQAVSNALNQADLRPQIPVSTITLYIDFAFEATTRNLLNNFEAVIVNTIYKHNIEIQCQVAEIYEAQIKTELINRTAGNIEFLTPQ